MKNGSQSVFHDSFVREETFHKSVFLLDFLGGRKSRQKRFGLYVSNNHGRRDVASDDSVDIVFAKRMNKRRRKMMRKFADLKQIKKDRPSFHVRRGKLL